MIAGDHAEQGTNVDWHEECVCVCVVGGPGYELLPFANQYHRHGTYSHIARGGGIGDGGQQTNR